MLVAAARRGARVRGVELDAELAAAARGALAEAGVDGTIVAGDIREERIDADVVFAYLSPATLQRLAPHLATLPPGARVVTVGFGLPGHGNDASHEGCFLYRAPLRRMRRDGPPGWPAPGLVAAVGADRHTLVAARVRHPGGAVRLHLSPELEAVVDLRAGADRVGGATDVVVDLVWTPQRAGTRGAGRLDCEGVAPLQVFFGYSEGRPGVWHVGEEACARIAALVQDPARDVEALLDTARAAS